MGELIVIGGGLAGSEAAWQAAEAGIEVILYEMRPVRSTGAHISEYLSELVCSNSLGGINKEKAPGLLKEELRYLGSLLMKCAEKTHIPAGGSLAVDRDEFAKLVTETIYSHPKIRVIREEVKAIPVFPLVIATGPLTSPDFAAELQNFTGKQNLFFYDAIAPIIESDSIDMKKAFWGSRYSKGVLEDGDYINCPMSEAEYNHFISELIAAEQTNLNLGIGENGQGGHATKKKQYFEGCLPVEELARRGHLTLAYGPMRPVGLIDPRTQKRPYAVIQLRQDNLAASNYNVVGFQTNLKYGEQARVFRQIPGLEQAEFVRYGQMHKNTFMFAPEVIFPTLQSIKRKDTFFAGQITGIEGYVGNVASGWLAGTNAARIIKGQSPIEFPRTTIIGALCYYITHASSSDFQPMKANLGIVEPLSTQFKNKKQKGAMIAERSIDAISQIVRSNQLGKYS